jgi:hypothetical protein
MKKPIDVKFAELSTWSLVTLGSTIGVLVFHLVCFFGYMSRRTYDEAAFYAMGSLAFAWYLAKELTELLESE